MTNTRGHWEAGSLTLQVIHVWENWLGDPVILYDVVCVQGCSAELS